jgi:hypothetical protein
LAPAFSVAGTVATLNTLPPVVGQVTTLDTPLIHRSRVYEPFPEYATRMFVSPGVAAKIEHDALYVTEGPLPKTTFPPEVPVAALTVVPLVSEHASNSIRETVAGSTVVFGADEVVVGAVVDVVDVVVVDVVVVGAVVDVVVAEVGAVVLVVVVTGAATVVDGAVVVELVATGVPVVSR